MARAAAWRALLLGLCSSRDSAWIAPTLASCSLQCAEPNTEQRRRGQRPQRCGQCETLGKAIECREGRGMRWLLRQQ